MQSNAWRRSRRWKISAPALRSPPTTSKSAAPVNCSATNNRMASAENDEALRDLQVDMIDRFGLLPEPTNFLFRFTELKLKAQAMGVRKIEAGPQGGRILFDMEPK